MSEKNMQVFGWNYGRNFRIVDADVVWTDFARNGNPRRNVPAGGYPTIAIRFDSPQADAAVVEMLKEKYDLKFTIVTPKEGQTFDPYNRLIVAARFDHFPPRIVLHSGNDDVLLSDKTPDPDISLTPEQIAEIYENIKGLDDLIIERMDLEVNVSRLGKAYARSIDIWLKLDDTGAPARRERNAYYQFIPEELMDN